MPLSLQERTELYALAKQLRKDVVIVTNQSGGAHIGGGLSALDVMVILYFKYLNIDPNRPDWEERDRFVLSKGHAAVAYAPVLARRGYFPMDELKTFNKFGSPFGMHPDSRRIRGCDASTGSLGHGLPMAVGMALAARVQRKTYRTYCLLGDGECNEGVVWEALMAAAHYRLTNLIPIIDRNRLMIDGPTEEVMGLDPLEDKLAAFGFDVISVNGNDLDELSEAFDRAVERSQQPDLVEHDAAHTGSNETQPAVASGSERPICIVANTVKGKGVDFMERQVAWHYGSIDAELREKALASIDRMYERLDHTATAGGKS